MNPKAGFIKAKKVEKQLNQAIQDGNNLAGWTAESEKLTGKIDDVTSQLAQKAQKVYVDTEMNKKATKESLSDIGVEQINKNKGKFDQTYMTDEFLQQIAGDTPINAVPADESVTPQKTTFVRLSKNMFNKETVVIGKTLNNDGELVDDPTRAVSAHIPVQTQTTLNKSHISVVHQYVDGVSVRYSGNTTQDVYIPNPADTIRISMNIQDVEYFYIGIGIEEYEPHGKVMFDGSAVNEKDVSESFRNKIDIIKKQEDEKREPEYRKYPNQIVHLIGGEPLNNFTFNRENTTLLKNENITWMKDSHGWEIRGNGGSPQRMRFQYVNPISIPPSSAVGAWVYVPDITKINSITLQLFVEPNNTTWSRAESNLKEGWNLLRFPAYAGSIGDWEQINMVQFFLNTNAPTSIVVGRVFLESSPKANLILVNDGGRKSWLNIAYPELKQRGIPTTWAINPNSFGANEDKMTEQNLLDLQWDLESSFSFHSWGSGITNRDMTPDQLREDTLRCVRYLKSKGLASDYLWRAAVHQNDAPHHEVYHDLVLASATPTGRTGEPPQPFPPINWYDIPRTILDMTTEQGFDDLFERMKKTHGTVVAYTHGISYSTTSMDMTPELWQYFLGKIDVALSEGWLNGTTFENLYSQIAKVDRVNDRKQLIDATR